MLTKLRTFAQNSARSKPETLVDTQQASIAMLLTESQGGNQQAFAQLYQDHVGAVYALCLRMTANVSLAEECTQQAFVNAWRSLGKFRGDAQFGTWLHRIAVNSVLAAQRKNQRRQQFEVAAELEEMEMATAQWPVEQHDDRALESAVAQLPERQRQVFVLHAVYGYSQAEVATQLDIAVGSVKAHYHNARGHLKGALGDQHDG